LRFAFVFQGYRRHSRGAMTEHEGKRAADVHKDDPWIQVHQAASLFAGPEAGGCECSGDGMVCQAADDRAIHHAAAKMATALTGCSAAMTGAPVRSATNTDCSANSPITPMGAAHAARGMRPTSPAMTMKISRYPN